MLPKQQSTEQLVYTVFSLENVDDTKDTNLNISILDCVHNSLQSGYHVGVGNVVIITELMDSSHTFISVLGSCVLRLLLSECLQSCLLIFLVTRRGPTTPRSET